MRRKAHRIIIDTNLFVSFLISKEFSKLDTLIFQNKATLLFSESSLEELMEVIVRPKFKSYFSRQDIDKLLILLNSVAQLIAVKSKINLCRDSKDNFLLELAKDGQATHLITGDKDLLTIKQFNKTRIVSIQEYIKLL